MQLRDSNNTTIICEGSEFSASYQCYTYYWSWHQYLCILTWYTDTNTGRNWLKLGQSWWWKKNLFATMYTKKLLEARWNIFHQREKHWLYTSTPIHSTKYTVDKIAKPSLLISCNTTKLCTTIDLSSCVVKTYWQRTSETSLSQNQKLHYFGKTTNNYAF